MTDSKKTSRVRINLTGKAKPAQGAAEKQSRVRINLGDRKGK